MLKTKLWSHQLQMKSFALKSFTQFGYCIWFAGMAVGKTLTTLAVRDENGAELTLVLTTKAALEGTWPQEIARHTEGVDCLALTEHMVVGGKLKKVTTAEKAAILEQALYDRVRPLIVVINYESAVKIASTLAKIDFKLVVADECHNLKGYNGKTLKTLSKAFLNVPAKLAMTGTLFNDRPTDVWGQIAFLDPYFYQGYVGSKVLGRYTDFFDAYVNYYVNGSIKIPIKGKNAYKNIPNLLNTINPFTFYVDTEKVLDLPPTRYIRREIIPSARFLKQYETFRKDMVLQIGDKLVSEDTVLVQSLRLAQMSGGYAMPYHVDAEGNFVESRELINLDDGNAKLNALLELDEEINGRPYVIFTRFTEDLKRITSALTSRGKEVLELSGRIHQHTEFQAGKGDVLVANMAAGSAGITLTRAGIVVDYSTGYSRTDYDQSRYRVRRPDSPKEIPILYYELVVKGTIDELIFDILKGKGSVAAGLRSGLVNGVKIA